MSVQDGHAGVPTAGFPADELDYALPESLIAQRPPARREDARMLGVDRQRGQLRDGYIVELPGALRAGDLLVLNDTRVLPAKFNARRATGGVVPGLFTEEEQPGSWRVMLQGTKRLRPGESLAVRADGGQPITLELEEYYGEGQWRVRVEASGTVEEILHRIGRTPLPPYIHRTAEASVDEAEDCSRYQTVYARVPGAIAAPTAGLHLTESLLGELHRTGVATTAVTLHVGVGTFKPIAVDCLSQHVMHVERFELPPAAAEAVRTCRERGGRVVAVGTTSVRVLESAADGSADARLVQPHCGATNLFIYPPYTFRVVDALLTNFHLPRSTLLALVMSFAGIALTRRAYEHAIAKRYRFYSYGDAMLIE
ncbi:MAG: tRNA preQ1(34) S-adenosylmethionine ribosyltransferase-isomerase QueA [Planctomycetes bacterium]|nr:tRNA preQ1(34) S-adenosylmethionine ribosyltransferase-isomerase QueA [Planctomycetota bacterium]